MKLSLKNRITHILRSRLFLSIIGHSLLKSEPDERLLRRAIRRAIKNVPFYNDYKKYISGKSEFNIKDFPILHKAELIGKENRLISKRHPNWVLKRAVTSGTSCVSLKLAYSICASLRKNVVADHGLNQITSNPKIGILRGYVPKNDAICEKLPSGDIILSSYKITIDNVDEYIQTIRDNKIECLHVYPSSITILSRLIKQKYGVVDIPSLKGILSSSETFETKDRDLVKSVFGNVKIVDYYSQNEMSCCALSIDNGPYVFYNRFGFVELLPTGETTETGESICEIIATSILNKAMPFIRYATDDMVTIDSNGCITSILGRKSDLAVDKDGHVTPCTLLTEESSLNNVINYQFYQPKPGVMTFRVIVNDNFSDNDKSRLIKDLNISFSDRMTTNVEIVDAIERTKAGKQKRLVQDFDINSYI